jgi:hypothetical protein
VKSNSTATKALDRIQFPKEAIDRISEILTPGSWLVVSDSDISGETGKAQTSLCSREIGANCQINSGTEWPFTATLESKSSASSGGNTAPPLNSFPPIQRFAPIRPVGYSRI